MVKLNWLGQIPNVLEKIMNLIKLVRISTSNGPTAALNDTVLRVELQVEGEIGIEQLKKVL